MSAPAVQLTFDRLAPFPQLLLLRAAAAAGDFGKVVEVYQQLPSWDLRTAAVRAVGETAGVEQQLAPFAQDPDAPLARAMLAARHIEIGWDVRSGKRAQHVKSDQFATFHAELRKAEVLLIDVTAREPDNLAAWTMRMMTVRGLELGQSEARRRWDHIARHDPHHLAGQTQLVQQLCPKWSGSLEQLHAFATERAYAAPAGSLNGTLVVEAHLEHAGSLDATSAGLTYLKSDEVRRSVHRAAAHSVLHADFQPAYNWATAHSAFALYHSMIGDPAAAAVHFRAMGQYAHPGVWEYHYGDAQKKFLQHRADALGKA